MRTYKLRENDTGIEFTEGDSVGLIPKDGVGWDKYQSWLAAGNTPQPAYTLAEYKLKRVRDINAEAHQRITGKWPAWSQSNIALGLDPALAQQCTDDIAAVRVASNVATESINSALDIAAVQAVVVNWPVI